MSMSVGGVDARWVRVILVIASAMIAVGVAGSIFAIAWALRVIWS